MWGEVYRLIVSWELELIHIDACRISENGRTKINSSHATSRVSTIIILLNIARLGIVIIFRGATPRTQCQDS